MLENHILYSRTGFSGISSKIGNYKFELMSHAKSTSETAVSLPISIKHMLETER